MARENHIFNQAGRRSIVQLIEPLTQEPVLACESLGSFEIYGESYSLPRIVFHGSNTSELRIGIFAAILEIRPVQDAVTAVRVSILADHKSEQ